MTKIIDLNTNDSISVIHLEVLTPQVTIGENMAFTFTLQNTAETPLRVYIRYEIGYCTCDGAREYKLYKMSSRICPPGFLLFNRRQLLELPSGHELCPGICELRIVINGKRLKSVHFDMVL